MAGHETYLCIESFIRYSLHDKPTIYFTKGKEYTCIKRDFGTMMFEKDDKGYQHTISRKYFNRFKKL